MDVNPYEPPHVIETALPRRPRMSRGRQLYRLAVLFCGISLTLLFFQEVSGYQFAGSICLVGMLTALGAGFCGFWSSYYSDDAGMVLGMSAAGLFILHPALLPA